MAMVTFLAPNAPLAAMPSFVDGVLRFPAPFSVGGRTSLVLPGTCLVQYHGINAIALIPGTIIFFIFALLILIAQVNKFASERECACERAGMAPFNLPSSTPGSVNTIQNGPTTWCAGPDGFPCAPPSPAHSSTEFSAIIQASAHVFYCFTCVSHPSYPRPYVLPYVRTNV